MSDPAVFQLENPPIVEAVMDIDCDLPAGLDFASLATVAQPLFSERYPKFRPLQIQRHEFKKEGDAPPQFSVTAGIEAFQFLTDDEREIVQVRTEGYSFNRLAPYSSLDDYLGEIERTWQLFVRVVGPVQIRRIGLRYINRILLPTLDGLVELTEYLKLSPRLPDEETLQFTGFVNQHSAVEVGTGNQANIILVMELLEGDKLPLIFDIATMHVGPRDPQDWSGVKSVIDSLRHLKNLIFWNTLTEKCLNLFRQ